MYTADYVQYSIHMQVFTAYSVKNRLFLCYIWPLDADCFLGINVEKVSILTCVIYRYYESNRKETIRVQMPLIQPLNFCMWWFCRAGLMKIMRPKLLLQ